MDGEEITAETRSEPGEAERKVFRDRLTFVLRHPLMAGDPVAAAIVGQMLRQPDPAHFADLMALLAERGLDLAYQSHGAAGLATRRAPADRATMAAEDDAPLRLLLKL